jgi:hypothetical protein
MAPQAIGAQRCVRLGPLDVRKVAPDPEVEQELIGAPTYSHRNFTRRPRIGGRMRKQAVTRGSR